MNQSNYQKELLQNRHPKYYQELTERKPYQFKNEDVKPIAFYLPQFHHIPENDEWWGRGFTEWTNVTKAMPQFEGHYQPHLAGELGYYNVMTDGVMERQIELAKMYGIYGFCFHFYMFDKRKRLLERPLNKFLANQNLDMPFCLCYANENWTRRWDGLDNKILMEQTYGESFEADLAKEMFSALNDARYLRIDGKPLIIIYRINLLPNLTKFAQRFRLECHKLGIEEIYLCSALVSGVDAREFGFEDNIEFPLHKVSNFSVIDQLTTYSENFSGHIFSYPQVVKAELDKEITFPCLRGTMPSWDNEARKPNLGHIYHGSTPKLYQAWLQGICYKTIAERSASQRFVFINAWNEWAEGAHLEPDRRYGYAYLEATYQAVKNQQFMPNIQEIDFLDLDSQQISANYIPKYFDGSHMQLFYYQNNEINVSDAHTLYFSDDDQTIFVFELDSIIGLTHLRIDLTNFPVIANIDYVKLIVKSSELILSICSCNASFINDNEYIYLHDDPINVYYIKPLEITESFRVEVSVRLEPIKKTDLLNVAKGIILKQSIQNANAQQQLEALRSEIGIKEKEMVAIHSSISWRVTQPLRVIKKYTLRALNKIWCFVEFNI